jgi:hypothetical protein
VTILIFWRKVYPSPIVILPFSQRKSESAIFGSSRCSDSHEQLMQLKKKVKTCPGTVLQCTGNVAFSLVMNRGGFSRSGWAVWSLLWGITFRTIWIERKDAVFYDQKWHLQKVKIIIWKSLLDYDRVAWERCLWIVMKSLIAKHQYLRSFDKVIC